MDGGGSSISLEHRSTPEEVALSDNFDHTLARFLGAERPQGEPFTSVFDLLSEETRAYLRERTGATLLSTPEPRDPSRTAGGPQDPSRTVGGPQDPSRTAGGPPVESQDPSRTAGGPQDPSRTAGGPQDPSRTAGGPLEEQQDLSGTAGGPPASQESERRRVRLREPTEAKWKEEEEVSDALANYMRTMQRFIAQTGPLGKVTDHQRKFERPSSRQDKLGRPSAHQAMFGYEQLGNVGRALDPSVRRWLIGLRLPNLAKYLALFEANEVDGDSLKLLTEAQLRRMGVTKYGPLNKMLHSIRVMRNCDPPRVPPPPTDGPASARSQRGPEAASVSPRRPLSARNDNCRPQQARKERCLLRLLAEAHEGSMSVRSSKSGRRPGLPAGRCAVSGAELVQKATKEIARAASKYQSKLEQDAQKKEEEEKKAQQLAEKREKLAAGYRRRQMAARADAMMKSPKIEHAPRSSSAPSTPRTPRKKTAPVPPAGGFGVKENLPNQLTVETQVGLDAQKPNLIFEDQLNDLELQIQNLVDVQDLRQSDSASLLSCIDQLQSKLHKIQAIVAQQKAKLPHPAEDGATELAPKAVRRAEAPKRVRSSLQAPGTPRGSDLPGLDMTQTDLKFSERDFLGEGSFTQVFRGRFRKREVAVKRLKTPLTTEDKIRLANEVGALMELQHENINQLLGCVVRMKFPLVLAQLARGGSLHQLLKRSDPLDHCAFFQIAEDVCAGLAYLHSSSPLSPRPHLRLTSHNVLLEPSLRARLSDVGLSRLRHECARAIREAGAGRSEWSQLAWMAPEVVSGEEAGPPADIFSLGVLLWEMMMRQTPYEGLTTFQMVERIRDGPALTIPEACPVGLRGIIRRCWQSRRIERVSAQEALLSVTRLKFPVGWQTVLQSAGLSAAARTDVALCRRLIALVLDLPLPEPSAERCLPPSGPCGVLSCPLPDLDLAPVSRIEELAQKVSDFITRPGSPRSDTASPLTAELSARGAVWDRP